MDKKWPCEVTVDLKTVTYDAGWLLVLWTSNDFADTNHTTVHQLDSAKVGLSVVWPSPLHWMSVAALAHLLLCEVTGCKLPGVSFPIWKVSLLLFVGPSTTVIDIPFKQCYTIKFTAKILPWWHFCSAVFFFFALPVVPIYTPRVYSCDAWWMHNLHSLHAW